MGISMFKRALRRVVPSRIGSRSGWSGWLLILICAVAASFWDLIKADLDCHLVVARGRVRSADANGLEDGRVQNSRLQLVTDGGHFEVDVDSGDQLALKNLLDAEVEVTGVAAGKFD